MSPARWGRAALAWAFEPDCGLRLQAFRWTLTFALLVYTVAWSLDAGEWLTAAGYHVSPAASRGFQLPVPLLPAAAVPVFLVIYIGSMVAVLSGLRPRLFCWPIFLGLLYVTAADRLAAFSMNKIALAAYAVLLLAPWASADAGVGSEPEGRGERAREAAGEQLELRSRWPIRILQITLILQYLGAGICKLRGDWLESGQVLSLQVQGVFMTDLAAWMVRALPTWIWAGLQHGALAFELAAPLLFASRRLRPLAFVWGVAMHLAIGLMMYRVGFFSLSVVAFYVLFLDADTLRRLIGRAA